MSPSVKPFNEAKYKALMDGLECSEIRFNKIHNWNPIFRIDAEFYNKRAITIDTQIRKMPHLCLNKEDVVSGPFGSTLKSASYLAEGPVPFIRIENIKGGFYVDTLNIMYISEEDNNRIKNSALRLDDIVLSKVGNSIGYFARIDKRIPYCNISENNIGIKLGTYQESFKHYLVAYLNCSFAQKLVARRTSGNAQPKLNVGDMCLIPIPTFSDAFYKVISNLIIDSENLIATSQEKYRYAEKMLASTIDMVDRSSTKIITSLKSLSESFLTSGRLDAEYYQPKYDDYERALHTSDSVQSLCNLYDKNFLPKDENEYPYIELANVGTMGEISDVEVIGGKDLPTRARRRVKKGQIIVASVEGSLQSCALITDEFDGALCSTGFYVLDSDSINPETLLVLFKSEPIQALMKQRCSGTILTAISKDELLGMPLPQIDTEIQKEISQKIQESFALRHKSEQLLEYAKQAVEMAIEQGEDVAMKWLESKVSE